MHMRYLTLLLLFATFVQTSSAVGQERKPLAIRSFTPTEQYKTVKLQGFSVIVNPILIADKLLHAKTLKELEMQLYRIVRTLPRTAVDRLRDIPIWVEKHQASPPCMCYHAIKTKWLGENGFNPDKNGCVDLGNAENFLTWTHQQPWMVLHELAHGYHDRLPGRFENKAIRDVFQRSVAGDKYGEVPHVSGKPRQHYAANNQMEYFAEGTEAYFGRNDFFPFVRTELKTYDPQGFMLQEKIWNNAPRKPFAAKKDAAPKKMPWDMRQLAQVPEVKWLKKETPVRELLYASEAYSGESTQVFAYYATPGSLAGDPSLDVNLPAVVLVHGGGGTAFSEWVELWAKRGYAAIAMDLGGRGAGRKPLENGGPDQGDDTKFGAVDEPNHEQWTYHAVAAVVRAHTLIGSFSEVDENRTAITGISWGGYLTCIVAGIDRRFKAAVPVYGCGYLGDASVWLGRFAKMKPEQREKWLNLWDPSQYVGGAEMPVLFVNGTNDFAYHLEAYHKTYRLVAAEKRHTRITVRMPHGHSPGWAPQEIGLFIDQQLREGKPLPRISEVARTDRGYAAQVQSSTKLKSAEIHYTTDEGANRERQWKSLPAILKGTRIEAAELPKDTKICFVTLKDERGAIVSSELVFLE